MSLIGTLTQILSGDADDPSRDMGNWNAIRNVVNGNLDTTNLSSTAAITAAQTALGGTFSTWANWTPGWTGFSANPTLNYARWMQIGKLVIITYSDDSGGTSNSTSFTITGLPATPQQTAEYPLITARDSSSVINTGILVTTALSTTATLYPAHNSGNWTSSGTKGAGYFTMCIEV